jgi:lipopolysaccharide export LptBFGC system permease protein LptF
MPQWNILLMVESVLLVICFIAASRLSNMSKTLFWYMFRELMRVFIMAIGALAGIMSFAGLLRPLTENGLDMGQVSKMLTYMSPAMSTYSLPVAALFATTMVYGRFAADNELTAMRAGGIGYISLRRFSVVLPAVVLGLITALISLLLLCFVVPIYSLKVEEVIYSNIARLIATKIERNHEIDFPSESGGTVNVFAQSAQLITPDPNKPLEQAVELIGPAIVKDAPPDLDHPDVKTPQAFWMARSAALTIQRHGPGPGESASLLVHLYDGVKFPRQFANGGVQVGVAETTFGPIDIPSPIDENVKFMPVGRLDQLLFDPSQSQKIQVVLHDIVRRERERMFLDDIASRINGRDAKNATGAIPTSYTFIPGGGVGDSYIVGGASATADYLGNELILKASAPNQKLANLPTSLDKGSSIDPATGNNSFIDPDSAGETDDGRNIWLVQMHGSQRTLSARAAEMHITAHADDATGTMSVSIELTDAQVRTQEGPSDMRGFARGFSVPMSDKILAVSSRKLNDFKNDPLLTSIDVGNLTHEQVVVINGSMSELHSRASFALSCLILVFIGCALGAMFRSGNFLTAFAVSFIPALLCMTLIVCGQQMATHVPFDMNPATFHNPLKTALGFIWVGNLLVLFTAIYLTVKLQKR